MSRHVLVISLLVVVGSSTYFALRNYSGAPPSPNLNESALFEYEMISAPPGNFTLYIPLPNTYETTYLEKQFSFEKPFLIGKYEVTNEQWNICYKMGGCDHPAIMMDGEGLSNPVIRVNWHDAYAFSRWISKATNQRYRLPLEEEWVYAAYMGAKHKEVEVEYDYSNLTGISSIIKLSNPRGSYPTNSWGISDFSGNVWEWTLTCWFGSEENIKKDRTSAELNSPSACTTRIAQGETRSHIPDFISDTYSGGCSTLRPAANLGVRLVREE